MNIAPFESKDRKVAKTVIAIFVFPLIAGISLLPPINPFTVIGFSLQGCGWPTLGKLAYGMGCLGGFGMSFYACKKMWPRMPTVLQVQGNAGSEKGLRGDA